MPASDRTGGPDRAGGQTGSEPLSMHDLRGKAVVLIDFWTYSCVNCIRTLPHLKRWHDAYKDKGLMIVGVHTPEFEFEKNVENVERAVREFGIEYPVVMDSDYQIWSLYSNNVWPRKFLIDKEGHIVYDHAGEGGYRETEEAIQKTLLELDSKLKFPQIESDPSTMLGTGKVCLPVTPELYLGAMRGSTRLTMGGRRVWDYRGIWKIHPEFIEHERKSEGFEDCIILNFEASEVNLVMEHRDGSTPLTTGRPATVRLELDGKRLRDIDVREAKMYNLISPSDLEHDHGSTALTTSGGKTLRGELKIYCRDEGLRAYAFTFGGCALT